MIKLAIEQNPGEFFPHTRWECPKCGSLATYYTRAPFKCNNCGEQLPNFNSIRNYLLHRKMYHRENT